MNPVHTSDNATSGTADPSLPEKNSPTAGAPAIELSPLEAAMLRTAARLAKIKKPRPRAPKPKPPEYDASLDPESPFFYPLRAQHEDEIGALIILNKDLEDRLALKNHIPNDDERAAAALHLKEAHERSTELEKDVQSLKQQKGDLMNRMSRVQGSAHSYVRIIKGMVDANRELQNELDRRLPEPQSKGN